MTETRSIRLVIVDDHDMLRGGLALFIQTCPDLQLVGEASSGKEALEVCQRLQPDIVLMDLKMPEMDGITAIRMLRDTFPSIRTIALSSFADENLVPSALSAGAIGYLLKNTSVDALATAIRDAYIGKVTLAPEAAQALVNAAQRPTVPNYPLSAREQEVLGLLVNGLTNTEIAEQLVIGTSTVKKHVSSVFAKLGVTSRSEAVALAMRHHLVAE
jgi:two-component system, NarL family, response regulator LiaR